MDSNNLNFEPWSFLHHIRCHRIKMTQLAEMRVDFSMVL